MYPIFLLVVCIAGLIAAIVIGSVVDDIENDY